MSSSTFAQQSKADKSSNQTIGFVRRRMAKAAANFTFWVILVVVVLGAGAIGVWVEVVKYMLDETVEASSASILLAIYTFFPTVAASSASQILLSQEPNVNARQIKAFLLLISAITFILTCVHAFDLFTTGFAFGVGILLVLLWLTVWWFANAADRTFYDDRIVDPEAPLGGALGDALQGDASGYNQ